MFAKKGAMFGLDARIALVIFASLTAISSASLFSAIEKSKATVYMSEIENIIKSTEAFWLDVGTLMQEDGRYVEPGGLISNSRNYIGWNGPYIKDAMVMGGQHTILKDIFKESSYRFIRFHFGARNAWPSNYTSSGGIPSCTATDCALYFMTYDASESYLDIYNKLNNLVDGGGDNYHEGKVRLRYPTRSKYYIYYEMMPYTPR